MTDGQEKSISRRERRKQWKKQARERAVAWLREKRGAGGRAERKQLRASRRIAVKKWKHTLDALPIDERRDQMAAYRVFRRRIRPGRRVGWGVVLALILVVVMGLGPMLPMLTEVLQSQKYTDSGVEVDRARARGQALSAEICSEGFVLLKNDEDFLPLRSNRRLSVFGDDAYNFVYGGSGSAGADQSDAESLFDAFAANGLDYDRELDALYRSRLSEVGGGAGSTGDMVRSFLGLGGEDDGDWLDLEISVIEKARLYSDTALVVLSSQELESSEIDPAQLQPMKPGTARAALIDAVCEAFEHVIVVINSGNVMELGFLEDYDAVDAAVWVGSPGPHGCEELAKLLTGRTNPSGRTVDTWPVSIEREPAYAAYGDHSYDGMDMHVMSYDEGIYVGYRYYETWFGGDEADYAENVVYPFGYGLSYTSFTEELTDFSDDGEQLRATVEVRNTGSAAGRQVVQLYFMPPYYPGGIEKSAIELAAFGKTGELQPGESEELTLSFDVRDMSSYSTERGCFVLEHGDYRVALGRDVHAALLSEDYRTYSVPSDILYREDDATGAEISGLFTFAEGNIRYMSRADMDFFPVKPSGYAAPQTLAAELAEYERALTPYSQEHSEQPRYGKYNSLMLKDLKGLDYDDERWELFLDQFTLGELCALSANGGWHTGRVARLGVPAMRLLDGPSGLNSMLAPLDAVAYPMSSVLSSTWDTELARRLGEAIGDEARVCGVNGWYAPAMNIHRLSVGGRNNEYYSEDPALSGAFAAQTVAGVQSRGVIAFIKHFVCNDVELNARSDVSIQVSEQALREIYLRPFELAVKQGGAAGVMSSFSRLGAQWCGGSGALLRELLREEWGFCGVVSTDACLGPWMDAELTVKNGNDLMLDMGLQRSEARLKSACKDDPIGTAWALRDCAHNICYTIVNITGLCG